MQTVTLTGTYQLPDGTPAAGTIEVIPSVRQIVDADGNVILSGRVKVKLDETGSFSVDLPATDDATLNPTGFGYTVAAKLHHAHLPAVSFQLPAAVPTVDIADVTTVDPATFTPDVIYAPAADLAAVEGRVSDLEDTRAPLYVVDAAIYGDGATDCVAHIQSKIDVAFAAGGGTVYVPPGTYRVSTAPIVPKSRVSIIGAGIGQTVFMGYGNFQVFYYHGTVADVTEDVTFANFEIDGTNQSNGGVYTSAMKGIQIDSGRRIIQRDLYVHHTGATGLGSDDLMDSVYENCIADYCGRLNDGTQPGGAGIGFAVGVHAVENVVVRSCVTRNNGTHGIFFENQSGVDSTGIQIINHYASGNGKHGIADAGGAGLQVIGGVSKSNAKSGFAAYRGTYAGATGPGRAGSVRGLDCNSNTEHGVHIDASEAAVSDWIIEGNRCWGNTKQGILIENGAAAMESIHLLGNRCYSNQLNGIRFQSSGGSITDVVLDNNHCRDNGKNASAGVTERNGITLAQSVNQLRVTNNRCWDGQVTKTQQYGLYLTSGTYTGGVMENNDWCQNAQTANVSLAATYSSFRIGFNNGHTVWTGTPEGSVTAPVGTLFRRLDGGASTTLYVKETGSGNTGWVAK